MALALLLVGCIGAAPADNPSPPPSPTTAGLARLQPADGAYFGLNLDWGNETAAEAIDRLGRTPAVWVEFTRFPLDDGGRANLDRFIDQVAAVGGTALITLEPHVGLGAVTREAANESADYIAAFRRVAAAVHERAPNAAMVWAPSDGRGYPFLGGAFAAKPDSPVMVELDTDGDGQLTGADDPYAPYYPGDDVVDWVGMSLYHWGLAYPWGENEMPPPGAFAAMVRGQDVGALVDGPAAPDFYTTYAEGHDRPMAIVETAILYDPAATSGPTETRLKSAWFEQVFGASTRTEFPRIGMLNWFEWRKEESEVSRVIDWRLGSDPAMARSLLDEAPGWLIFGS